AEDGRGQVLIYDGQDVRNRLGSLEPTSVISLGTDDRFHLGKVLAAGFIGSDPFADLVVGAHDWSSATAVDLGRALIFDGSAALPATRIAGDDEDRTIRGTQAFQRVGLGLLLI